MELALTIEMREKFVILLACISDLTQTSDSTLISREKLIEVKEVIFVKIMCFFFVVFEEKIFTNYLKISLSKEAHILKYTNRTPMHRYMRK